MIGVFESIFSELKQKSASKNFLLSPKDIAESMHLLSKAQCDAHCIIAGQNGVGKSYLMLAIGKELLKLKTGQKSINLINSHVKGEVGMFFSYHSRADLSEFIANNEDSVILIDELKNFFDYRMTMTRQQNDLYNKLEYARSKRNSFIGCVRDYTKLDINYRNAKAEILIYLFDRVVDMKTFKTKCAYGYVFIGNASVEMEDKFQFSYIRGYDMATTRALIETLPSWVGNMIVKPIKEYGITQAELNFYEYHKEMGVTHSVSTPIFIEKPKKSKQKALFEA